MIYSPLVVFLPLSIVLIWNDIRDAYAGGQGELPLMFFSKDLIILVQKCLLCAFNRNLAPCPRCEQASLDNMEFT